MHSACLCAACCIKKLHELAAVLTIVVWRQILMILGFFLSMSQGPFEMRPPGCLCADILLVYHLGNSQIMSSAGSPWLSRKLRCAVGVLWGVWGLPIPRPHRIITLVGELLPGELPVLAPISAKLPSMWVRKCAMNAWSAVACSATQVCTFSVRCPPGHAPARPSRKQPAHRNLICIVVMEHA